MSDDTGYIRDDAALRAVVGKVFPIAQDKVLCKLDKHSRRFIELSPFLCLGTASQMGFCDVSPRGDPPGFVKILHDKAILIPERTGNRRADSMHNLLTNNSIGIIFFVPGISETLRLGGEASIVCDADLLSEMAVRGQVPNLAIKIDIKYVFFHCAKALIRSKLWEAESQIARSDFPTYGEIIHDQRRPEIDSKEIEKLVQDDYKNSLY